MVLNSPSSINSSSSQLATNLSESELGSFPLLIISPTMCFLPLEKEVETWHVSGGHFEDQTILGFGSIQNGSYFFVKVWVMITFPPLLNLTSCPHLCEEPT